ncbi:hypothetical protein HYPSUDRAFT_1100213 [Hypholoma sublateritium FD-334 SS-4]|uniref:Uncharacterized protein n=1 Tax=Hypholoma sublateritium (strain FD-334 SS-4) TaxID=945553 RepID=A0A0D2KU97_HYPSF|nr:hypothetical protein HYPSUDRAFT_1100213 [Hypholoma sublateritium FD-334 SS-4]
MSDRADNTHWTARLTLSRMLPLRETNIVYARTTQDVLTYLETRFRVILKKMIATPAPAREGMVRPLFLEVRAASQYLGMTCMDFPMITVPIVIRTLVVNLFRLQKANDVYFSADLVDYLHTPVAAGSWDEELPRYSLDWWNSSTFPVGNEEPALWMDFDTMAQCRSMDRIRRPKSPPPSGNTMPRQVINVVDDRAPNVRLLPDGYCRQCARLLDIMCIIQQEMKGTRNTQNGWQTIFKHRATVSQFTASGLHGLLCAMEDGAMESKGLSAGVSPSAGATEGTGGCVDAGAATGVVGGLDAGAGSGAGGCKDSGAGAGTDGNIAARAGAGGKEDELTLEQVKEILERGMMLFDPEGHSLELNFFSPTVALNTLDADAEPFDIISDTNAPPSLARGTYPDFFGYPPLGPDRTLPTLDELPAGWKQDGDTSYNEPVPSFHEIEEGFPTLDPASIFYNYDPPRASDISSKFAPVVVSSSEGSTESHHSATAPTCPPPFGLATVSSSESEGRAPTDHRAKAGFLPATISDSESEKLNTALPSKFAPATISSSENENTALAPASLLFAPSHISISSSESDTPQQSALATTPHDLILATVEDSDDDMSVNGDALAARINNAPMYTDQSFTHIPDDVLEPEDQSEGSEYDEDEYTEDGEYETEESESE